MTIYFKDLMRGQKFVKVSDLKYPTAEIYQKMTTGSLGPLLMRLPRENGDYYPEAKFNALLLNGCLFINISDNEEVRIII